MKQKHSFFVTAGIPSLFLIFSVLVLAVLSLLTLSSSRSSLSTAQHSMEQTEAYYTASAKATRAISQLSDSLRPYAEDASSESDYFSEAEKFIKTQRDLTWDSGNHTLAFSEKLSDTQKLSVVLKLVYPKSQDSSLFETLQWSTELTDTWKPDNSQNVFKGE